MNKQEIKILQNALLCQDSDYKLFDKLDIVTEKKIDIDENLLKFGIIAVRQLKSNAIAVVRKTNSNTFQLLGMGCGQPNRVKSTEIALTKCRENLTNNFKGSTQQLEQHIKKEMEQAILVSDAFFPFPDNIDLCAQYGIRTIFQPGGSLRDKAVIKRYNEKGIAMVFTGIRHFKH